MVAININEILGSYGGSGGYPGNDLKVIFKGVGGKDKQILNIKVVEIRVRHGSVIDSLQFVYKVKTDEKEELVEGIKYGGNGGKLDTITIDHEGGEYLTQLIVFSSNLVNGLRFRTSRGVYPDEINWYGKGKGQSFVIPVEGEIVLFGKSGGLLDSLGIYIVEGMSKIQQISQNTSADYQQIKMALAKWTDKFKSKTPEQVEQEINDLISNNNGKLPTDLPLDWKDQLARLPFLEKVNQDLTNEKNKIETESKVKLDLLNSDLQTKNESISNLQTDLSQVKAENTHLRDYELKKVNDELNKWKTTFPGQAAYEVETELNKPKLTVEQQDKINTYDEIKHKWEEWLKAFPLVEFSTPEEARAKYDEAIRNQKPTNHDQVLEDLNEWKTAFPKYKFPNKPEDIRKEYDKLTTNQKPTDYEQLKNELEQWTNTFSSPEFQGKTPAEIKAVIEKYKDQLNLRASELLAKYQEDLSRLVDNSIGRLKHISKDSLNNKYGKKVDKIAETGLTLENVSACMQHLNTVIAIYATEKATEWSKQIDNMSINDGNRATQVTEIVEFLSKIESIWKRVPRTSEPNNPFYLPAIENKATYQQQLQDLSTKWITQKRLQD